MKKFLRVALVTGLVSVFGFTFNFGLAAGQGEGCGAFGASEAYADEIQQDGYYQAVVDCQGGSGRGGVREALVQVSGGQMTKVLLYMSSGNYDYAVLNGVRADYQLVDGKSVFEFDFPGYEFDLTADTVAMSEPHEVDYSLSLSQLTFVGSEPVLMAKAEEKALTPEGETAEREEAAEAGKSEQSSCHMAVAGGLTAAGAVVMLAGSWVMNRRR